MDVVNAAEIYEVMKITIKQLYIAITLYGSQLCSLQEGKVLFYVGVMSAVCSNLCPVLYRSNIGSVQ